MNLTISNEEQILHREWDFKNQEPGKKSSATRVKIELVIDPLTSGAIQYGVPTKLLAGLAILADPKSANLMSPVSVSRMLPALISLRYKEKPLKGRCYG